MTYPATALTYGSWAYLKSEVGNLLEYGRDEASWNHEKRAVADAVVQRGVRAFYVPPLLPGERYGHEWSFLRPILSLSTYAPYAAGTVAVTSGVVTLTDGTFPSWAADGDLVVSGSTYSVDSRDSDTQITLDDTAVTVTAGAAYTLPHRPIYDLPSDFSMLDGPLTFARGETVLYGPIELVSEYQVRQRQQDSTSTGKPMIAAIRAKASNAGYEILFWPTPDAAYTIEYQSKINPAALSSSNTMPYGGTEHLQTILESCLAEAEAERGGAGIHAARYLERLAASVSLDRKLTSPDTLGLDGGQGEPLEMDRHELSQNLVGYNDLFY